MKRGKPLDRVRVVVTRPKAQASALTDRLRRFGARVRAAPAIQIVDPPSWAPLDAALSRLAHYDMIIFTSANAVERFFRRADHVLKKRPGRPRRLFAIGPSTARALRVRGWGGVAVPDRYEGAALARRIRAKRGLKILLPRARRAREALPEHLRRRGATVDVIEAYRTIGHPSGLRAIRRELDKGVDYVTFTSSSTVEHLIGSLGRSRARRLFRRTTAASIGPVTSATLRRLGIRNYIEATPFTAEGIVRAIISHHARGGKRRARR